MSDLEWTRYFSVYILQSIVIVFLSIIAFKVIRRNKNRLTIILSTFYTLNIIGLIFNLILLPIKSNPASTILYFIIFFTISFGLIFLVIFLRNLMNIDIKTNSKVDFSIIFIYDLLISASFFIPGGFKLSEATYWIPVYSWCFLTLLYIIITIMVVIPSIIYFKKLYSKFETPELKKKLNYFTFGTYGMFFLAYGVILYNTWQNPLFKLIWVVLALVIIPSGVLIYYGIARDL